MVNVSIHSSIAELSRKLSSDLKNKICNGFSGFQRLDIALKKFGSSDFFSCKHEGTIPE